MTKYVSFRVYPYNEFASIKVALYSSAGLINPDLNKIIKVFNHEDIYKPEKLAKWLGMGRYEDLKVVYE